MIGTYTSWVVAAMEYVDAFRDLPCVQFPREPVSPDGGALNTEGSIRMDPARPGPVPFPARGALCHMSPKSHLCRHALSVNRRYRQSPAPLRIVGLAQPGCVKATAAIFNVAEHLRHADRPKDAVATPLLVVSRAEGCLPRRSVATIKRTLHRTEYITI